jgi:hypothetical protein
MPYEDRDVMINESQVKEVLAHLYMTNGIDWHSDTDGSHMGMVVVIRNDKKWFSLLRFCWPRMVWGRKRNWNFYITSLGNVLIAHLNFWLMDNLIAVGKEWSLAGWLP